MAGVQQPATTRHIQEPTAFSMTETVIDRGHEHERSRTMTSDFEVIVEGATATTPPHHLPPKPQPQPRRTLDPSACPPVIPPEHPSRTLVLCFDGTGDQFDADNSNIVQLVSLLKKDDKTKQMVYYQTGIGTYTSPKVATPLMSKIRKTLDTMFASSIHAHVMSGYEFLMQNYQAGDRISMFGFSRGAYTARSLAGMLHKVGLLPADNFEQVPFAYKMYTRTDHIGWEQSNEFKKAFSIHVDIDFIGVWDTVDSVGIIPKRLPFTTSNTIVRTFRHAVALDERRAKFKANLWNRPTREEEKLGDQNEESAERALSHMASEEDISLLKIQTNDLRLPSLPKTPFTSRSSKEGSTDEKNGTSGSTKNSKNGKKSRNLRKQDSDEKILSTFERMYSTSHSKAVKTDIEEVWFAGCHCDVGGGSVSNKTRHSLARISLRWMVRECFKAGTGIMFKSDRLYEIGLDPTTLYPFVTPRPPPLPITEEHKLRKHPAKEIPIRPQALLTKKKPQNLEALARASQAPAGPMFLGSEEEEELRDALSPAYDQLRIQKAWWVLELMPLQLRYQRGDNQWVTYFASNLARPRFIPKQRTNGVKVHRSVKLRMEAEYEEEKKRLKGKKYQPKAVLRVEPTWVD
ncbi:hypothetical protein CC2G_012391 [Coprinopsis cinerea AmutBmut pab1-1]|nr:hypothetical protein CC2G_012391 [Coprinopsis cinerea AmutBmut pab1-1]